jgi:plastocyanin
VSTVALTTLLMLVLTARAGSDPSAAPATTGSVAGEVRLEKTPARRTAERYVGAVPASERSVQQVPTVVYLKGATLREDHPRPRLRLMQKDTAFTPGALVVPVGTMVEFPNADPFFHNVFSYSKPKRFDLGRYPQGETKSVRFDTPGIVKVYCEVHRSMRALVVVVASPYYAVVGADGRFVIPDVAPGRYELVVIDADRGTRATTVAVAQGRTSNVTVTLP